MWKINVLLVVRRDDLLNVFIISDMENSWVLVIFVFFFFSNPLIPGARWCERRGLWTESLDFRLRKPVHHFFFFFFLNRKKNKRIRVWKKKIKKKNRKQNKESEIKKGGRKKEGWKNESLDSCFRLATGYAFHWLHNREPRNLQLSKAWSCA